MAHAGQFREPVKGRRPGQIRDKPFDHPFQSSLIRGGEAVLGRGRCRRQGRYPSGKQFQGPPLRQQPVHGRTHGIVEDVGGDIRPFPAAEARAENVVAAKTIGPHAREGVVDPPRVELQNRHRAFQLRGRPAKHRRSVRMEQPNVPGPVYGVYPAQSLGLCRYSLHTLIAFRLLGRAPLIYHNAEMNGGRRPAPKQEENK